MSKNVYHHPRAAEEAAARILRPDGQAALVLLCDHASNHIPDDLGTLGLGAADRARHIAWDIGAAVLTEALADALDAPAVLARFSRLVIDPNRGRDDPTLVVALSDGTLVPGNRALPAGALEARLARFYEPYHDAIAKVIARVKARGVTPVLISVHSFTPVYCGVARPWQLGVLWNKDGRIARPLIARLRAAGFVVGDNEPYSGELAGDTLDRHGTQQGRPHALIEVRQDLIDSPARAAMLAAQLAPILEAVLEEAGFSHPVTEGR